jgi:hypothetical protein
MPNNSFPVFRLFFNIIYEGWHQLQPCMGVQCASLSTTCSLDVQGVSLPRFIKFSKCGMPDVRINLPLKKRMPACSASGESGIGIGIKMPRQEPVRYRNKGTGTGLTCRMPKCQCQRHRLRCRFPALDPNLIKDDICLHFMVDD